MSEELIVAAQVVIAVAGGIFSLGIVIFTATIWKPLKGSQQTQQADHQETLKKLHDIREQIVHGQLEAERANGAMKTELVEIKADMRHQHEWLQRHDREINWLTTELRRKGHRQREIRDSQLAYESEDGEE